MADKISGTRRRPRLILSAFDLEKQIRRLAETTLGPDRDRWPYRPLRTGFPILDEKIDGVSNRFYVVASGARVGKSTFALQLVHNVLLANPAAQALYISLDQPARDLNIRLVAMAGECHTSYVQYPSGALADRYDERRQKGLMQVMQLKDRLTIVDESLGTLRLKDIVSFIQQVRSRFDGPLLVVMDPIYKVRSDRADLEPEQQQEQLAQEVKTLCTSEQVAIIATTRLAMGAATRRPTLEDLEYQAGVLYDSDVIFLLYNDSLNDGNTPFLEWDWGTDDVMVPIFELNIVKNKMGPFSGRLYYRFKSSYSKFKECTSAEIDNYDQMLRNLRVHDSTDPMVEEGLQRIVSTDDPP